MNTIYGKIAVYFVAIVIFLVLLMSIYKNNLKNPEIIPDKPSNSIIPMYPDNTGKGA